MKRQAKEQKNMAKQMEIIQNDAQKIAAEANSLAVVGGHGASSGNVKGKLRQLQSRVDRLRRTLWRVQSTGGRSVVSFPAENNSEMETEPSLVDRVLALLDRRCG